MFKFSISDSDILENTVNTATYARGLAYYSSNRVRNFSFDEDSLTIVADVIGSKKYRVKIELYQDSTVADYECECPAYYEYDGICKHIVAVLKAAQGFFGKKET